MEDLDDKYECRKCKKRKAYTDIAIFNVFDGCICTSCYKKGDK